jgi:hypothetical protein
LARFEALVIATTDFTDPVYLRAGASQDDTVYLTHHDGDDIEIFAESVTKMLAVLRRQNPGHIRRLKGRPFPRICVISPWSR